ncbi:cytospin-A-like [Daphnia carinata]|uniref:cytospin-A-like n=1 Tax=Daphnia carinata TaxID=120202 RepID=UPI00257DF475|nr:cytospin-A-like [Daphnia carinata]
MMKFKSLFRRKASPTGNEANSAISPSASSISHSSSSSSLAARSASPPVQSNGHGAELVDANMSLGSPPITITSRIRSSTDPNLLSPRTEALPPVPGPSTSDCLMFIEHQDETPNCSNYPIHAINRDVIRNIAGTDVKEDADYAGATMRDLIETGAVGWERQSRQSSGSEVSGVSLACLQGRIQQMEETHHSTNEELQATLQELADLQVQLNEFQAENDKLKDDKQSLKRKLEIRTEQFKQARDQMESLKQHLLLQCNEAEDERKALQAKQMDLAKMLAAQQAEATEREQHVTWLTSRVRHLEACIDEGDSKLHSELSKLMKENEKLRQDKESTEGTAITAQDQLAAAQRDNTLLRDQISALQEENRTIRQKSKEEVADLEYKVEQLLAKKQSLIVETSTLHAAVAELESACRRHLEDKREMRTTAADQQVKLADALARRDELERLLTDERAKWEAQQEEWQQFQKDLLTTVRVANDFKLETLAKMEKVVEENRLLHEKLGAISRSEKFGSPETRAAAPVKPRVLRSFSTLDSSSTTLSSNLLNDIKPRAVATRVDKGSVKRIVENLEVTASNIRTKPTGEATEPASPSLATSPSPPVATVRPRSEPIRPTQLHRTESEVFLRSPARPTETRSSLNDVPTYNTTSSSSIKTASPPSTGLRSSVLSASDIQPCESSAGSFSNQPSDRKDPLAGLVKNGGSKRNALLKWCQTRTADYPNIDITNFSSSWNDGLALCALLHTYLPQQVPFESLNSSDVRHNFQVAFRASESVGIPTSLDIEELASSDRPDWQSIMTYITAIYKHFEI